MRVPCSIEETELENDRGRPVPGVVATCSRCRHETESFGTGEASRRRCLAVMAEECPENEENYYFYEDC
jgi:hypothetical protein